MASSNQRFHWANKNDIDGLPIRGITGGISPEGRRIFVIRADAGDRLVAGNYEEDMDQAEFQYGGPGQSQEWEYLVLNGIAYGMKLCSWEYPSHILLSIYPVVPESWWTQSGFVKLCVTQYH